MAEVVDVKSGLESGEVVDVKSGLEFGEVMDVTVGLELGEINSFVSMVKYWTGPFCGNPLRRGFNDELSVSQSWSIGKTFSSIEACAPPWFK